MLTGDTNPNCRKVFHAIPSFLALILPNYRGNIKGCTSHLGIEYENNLRKAISLGRKSTTMECRCFILSFWNKRRSFFTVEDFLSGLPDQKYSTVHNAISSLIAQKVLISIPRKCEGSLCKNVYSYYRKEYDFSLSPSIPPANKKQYDGAIIEIIESLQKDTQSIRCRRIGNLVSQCLNKGKITVGDYYPFMPHRSCIMSPWNWTSSSEKKVNMVE